MHVDAVVVGAGLAGLAAARDLRRAGVDVHVVEARDRAGGRVAQKVLPDGRTVQLGGEVVGASHTAYAALVAELGLTLEPAFTAIAGEATWALNDGVSIGALDAWMSPNDLAAYRQAEEQFRVLARSVDPDDPWSHPDASRLDRLSVGEWLRDVGAPPQVVRARDLGMLALASESIERTSLLSELRKEATAGAVGFYDYETWESLRVAEGSATVALRMGDELVGRIRLSAPVERISVGRSGCQVVLQTGEVIDAAAVLCTLPAGPLRHVHIEGVAQPRLRSLLRQRHALAAKACFVYDRSFWTDAGQDGTSYSEVGVLGGTWPQVEGVLSALVPPERMGAFLATAPGLLRDELVAEVALMFGDRALAPADVAVRRWGTDPWTLGYITSWRPGDVMGVGPLHGTHVPPFYVAGSDQWAAGYMEGAVRSGRQAAAEMLRAG